MSTDTLPYGKPPISKGKAKLGVLLSSAIPMTILLAFVLFTWTPTTIHDYRQLKVLSRVGVRTTAEITRYYVAAQSRADCNIHAEYHFSAPSQAQVTGKGDIADSGCRRNPRYLHTLVTHTMPIVYDPADPSDSHSNWDDSVFTHTPAAYLKWRFEMLGGFFLIALLFSAFMGWFYWKALQTAAGKTPADR